jgi:hypothetical protein
VRTSIIHWASQNTKRVVFILYNMQITVPDHISGINSFYVDD